MCGGAYGGKTTMAKLLEEKYGFIMNSILYRSFMVWLFILILRRNC